jgi:hypothetical protein
MYVSGKVYFIYEDEQKMILGGLILYYVVPRVAERKISACL